MRRLDTVKCQTLVFFSKKGEYGTSNQIPGEFPCDYIASDVFVRKRDWYKLGVYIKVQAKW